MPLFDKAEKVKIRSPQERTNRIDLTPIRASSRSTRWV